MPRLGPVSRSRLLKVLRANGITAERPSARPALVMWHPRDPARKTTVPNYDEIDASLLSQILRQVQKPRDEYLRVLGEISR